MVKCSAGGGTDEVKKASSELKKAIQSVKKEEGKVKDAV